MDPAKKKKSKKTKAVRPTFTTVRTSISDMSKSFSERADKVADVMFDNDGRGKKLEELFYTAGNVASDIKKSVRNVKPKDVLCDASYELGRFSRIARDRCVEIWCNKKS